MTETVQAAGKARWTRLATLGFGLAAAAPAFMLLSGLIFGLDLSDATFLFIPLVVLGILTFLVWRFGTWSKILGIVLGVLGAFGLFWLIFGLFVPGNFFDFVPGLMFIPGILLGLASCIAALVAKRRGHFTPAAEAGEARGIRIVLTALVVLSVLSGILTLVGRESADATGADVAMTMKDFEFKPKELTVAGGSKLFIDNDDPFLHTFTVEDLNIDESFTVGSSKIITIPTRPGTYYFYCKPHSSDEPEETEDDDSMNGTLTVT